MSTFFPGSEPVSAVIAMLRSLGDDLARIVAEEAPSEADLADATLLVDPRIVFREGTALIEHAEGHPLRFGATFRSEIYAIDLLAGWARTGDRFYRLDDRPPGMV